MIEKPTVKELLEHAENRYSLVIATAKRARQIAKGDETKVESDEKSPVTLAANEIFEDKVYRVDDNANNKIIMLFGIFSSTFFYLSINFRMFS